MNSDYRIHLGEQRLYSFEAAAAVAHEFLVLLEQHQVTPVSGSSLERMTYSLYDVLYRHEGGFISETDDIRALFNDLSALSELALHLVRVKDHRDFRTLIPHLDLLNQGEAGQTLATSPIDQAANKIFELLSACLAMRCGVNVELEAPDKGKGGNPDVLVTMRGARWGIACKALHSRHPEALLANIEKAIDQIENSPAETGFLFFNLTNILKREQYWSVVNESDWRAGAEPEFSAFVTPEEAQLLLQEELADFTRILTDHVGGEYLRGMFSGKKAEPGIFLYGHVLAGLRFPGGGALPMAQKWPTWAGFGDPEGDLDGVLNCFHHVLHDIP